MEEPSKEKLTQGLARPSIPQATRHGQRRPFHNRRGGVQVLIFRSLAPRLSPVLSTVATVLQAATPFRTSSKTSFRPLRLGDPYDHPMSLGSASSLHLHLPSPTLDFAISSPSRLTTHAFPTSRGVLNPPQSSLLTSRWFFTYDSRQFRNLRLPTTTNSDLPFPTPLYPQESRTDEGCFSALLRSYSTLLTWPGACTSDGVDMTSIGGWVVSSSFDGHVGCPFDLECTK